jgi:hypothetical protein
MLDNVTLVAIDSLYVDETIEALHKSMAGLTFASVMLFTHKKVNPKGIKVVQINEIKTRKEYSLFILKKLARHIKTTHVLIIQYDGYVIHPELWRDEWLEYDYIGAPWNSTLFPVGNGGFSLRSKRLLNLCRQLEIEHIQAEDVIICQTFRGWFEERGIRFAPKDIAKEFSYEPNGTGAFEDNTFGFHNVPELKKTQRNILTQVFVLAAGRQERWNSEHYYPSIRYKQLIRYKHETLLHRIKQQFGGCLVTANDELIQQWNGNYFIPERYDIICETVLSTMTHWCEKRKLFILADTIFSKEAVSRILAPQDEPYAFYGSKKQGEIFALGIMHPANPFPEIDQIINLHQRNSEEFPGRLWNLYRLVSGLPANKHEYSGNYFIDIEDGFTNDFDTQLEYKQWKEHH